MDEQLGAWLLFEQIAHHARRTEVVTLEVASGRIHRSTYGEVADRAQQLMHALDALGVPEGAPVATLAWNSQWHLECYFGIPCAGRVIHTVNVRLSPEEIAFILADAGDRVVFVDADLLPGARGGDRRFHHPRHRRGLRRRPARQPGERGVLRRTAGRAADEYPWRRIDENATLGLCYTSGTTGSPKGVAYTHRSTFLHALAATSATACRVGPGDTVLPMVPMFHASAWGLPYAAAGAGAKQVFLAGAAQPAAIVDLLLQEQVTIAAGVPTIWLSVEEELDARGATLPDLGHIIVGGSQPPRALMQRYLDKYDVPILQAWGMTETSPLASVAWPAGYMADWSPDEVMDAARSQAGRPIPGVRISIRDDDGVEIARDGTTVGTLLVRGPWVADALHQRRRRGTLDRGRLVRHRRHGGMECRRLFRHRRPGQGPDQVRRRMDLVAGHGERHRGDPDRPGGRGDRRAARAVAGAAARLHRARRATAPSSSSRVCARLAEAGFAKWQMPDRIEILDSIPRTSVGKYDKKVLRARFGTSA